MEMTETRPGRRNLGWLILSLILLVSGILILLSTWMKWALGLSGHQLWTNNFLIGVQTYTGNAVWRYAGGTNVIFTGLWTLIWGGIIILSALGMIAAYAGRMESWSRTWPTIAFIAGLIGAAMAIFNTVILARSPATMQYGMYVFLIFSVIALIASTAAERSPVAVRERMVKGYRAPPPPEPIP
jgi:hypothetical protein